VSPPIIAIPSSLHCLKNSYRLGNSLMWKTGAGKSTKNVLQGSELQSKAEQYSSRYKYELNF